jgi:hypothetical protein
MHGKDSDDGGLLFLAQLQHNATESLARAAAQIKGYAGKVNVPLRTLHLWANQRGGLEPCIPASSAGRKRSF